jgi:hypothetical protein
VPHAEAALELFQRPGFPIQLPAGQNLRGLKGSNIPAPRSRAPEPSNLALRFWPLETRVYPGQELIRVSLYT